MTLDNLRALLIDLDGTLYHAEEPIPGAAQAVATLREKGYRLRLVTNTTSRSRATLVAKLGRMGIPAGTDDILAPPYAAARYLHAQGITRAHLLLTEDARREFAGIPHTDDSPQVVVVGDLGPAWTYERLNQGFRHLMDGAQLIALGKSRYWRDVDGFRLDTGPFVAALESATGQQAHVIGKPAAPYYCLALDELGVPPQEAAMVGDDIETDIGGAQRAGLGTILLRTGKFRPQDLEGSTAPDLVMDSIAQLADHLAPAAARSL